MVSVDRTLDIAVASRDHADGCVLVMPDLRPSLYDAQPPSEE